MIGGALRISVEQAIQLTTPDSRATAREWINSQLPTNATVGVESYAPFVDPARFRIVESERAIDHPLGWYLDKGVDYIVLSQGMFGRYFNPPGRYPGEAGRYLKLMDSMQLLKRFNDGNYEVLVFKTLHGNSPDSQ